VDRVLREEQTWITSIAKSRRRSRPANRWHRFPSTLPAVAAHQI
jgi:hypothetical protein